WELGWFHGQPAFYALEFLDALVQFFGIQGGRHSKDRIACLLDLCKLLPGFAHHVQALHNGIAGAVRPQAGPIKRVAACHEILPDFAAARESARAMFRMYGSACLPV